MKQECQYQYNVRSVLINNAKDDYFFLIIIRTDILFKMLLNLFSLNFINLR